MEPAVIPEAPLFEAELTKNCIGQTLVIYYLSERVEADIAEALALFGALKFPLGGDCGVVRLDVPGKFLLTGLVGLKELKLTMKTAAPPTARAEFEEVLRRYLARKRSENATNAAVRRAAESAA